MRTTVTLDDDVFEVVKEQAAVTGKRFGKVLSELARRGLRSEVRTTKRRGVPVFEVSNGAEMIPSGRAARLLAEEEASRASGAS